MLRFFIAYIYISDSFGDLFHVAVLITIKYLIELKYCEIVYLIIKNIFIDDKKNILLKFSSKRIKNGSVIV